MNSRIEIKEIAKMDLAFISVVGSQNLSAAIQKIMHWAIPQNLMDDQSKVLSIYHDSYKTTEANKVRMSACLLLNKPLTVSGEIGLTSIEAGKYIIGSFEITYHEFEKSWTDLFAWMTKQGYKKSAKNPFEIYHNNISEHPEGKA